MKELLTIEYITANKMSFIDAVQYFKPEWTIEQCDVYLWEHTCYPFSTEMVIKQLNEQLLGVNMLPAIKETIDEIYPKSIYDESHQSITAIKNEELARKIHSVALIKLDESMSIIDKLLNLKETDPNYLNYLSYARSLVTQHKKAKENKTYQKGF